MKKIKLDSERKAWLLSFQCPRLTVKDVVQACKMNISTARKALNALVEYDLLFTSKKLLHEVETLIDFERIGDHATNVAQWVEYTYE